MAVLLALSPLTGSARPWLSALLGVAGGAAILADRLWRRRRGELPPARPAVIARPPWSVGLALAAVIAVFAPTLVWLFEEYTHSVWRNVHGVFIPLFVILLSRSALRADPWPERLESSAWGFPFLVAGLGLAVLDASARTHILSALGLLFCLPGLSLLFLGARRTRLIAGPLALTVFALPAPENMLDPVGLTEGTTALAEPILHVLGEPVIRHRTVYLTPAGMLSVGQNCSGLSALHAGLAFASVLALTARTRSRRILPILLIYPLVLAFNTMRCVVLVAITARFGTHFLDTPFHGLSGLLPLWGALTCLWLLADRRGLREAMS